MRRRPAGGEGALPNLIVIGAMSCGTTALHNLLDQHPAVRMSRPKELQYFVGPDPPRLEQWIGDRCERELVRGRRNWGRGVDWYRSHFDPAAPVRGESSPGYTAPYYADVAGRIAGLVPEVRLVMVARDPIECMRSQYRHALGGGRERREPETALGDPGGLYANRARFALAIEPYLQRFGRERIHVLTNERLRADPDAALNGVWDFLGLPRHPVGPAVRSYGGSDRTGWRMRRLRALPYSPAMRWAYRLPAGFRRRGWELALLGSKRSDRAVLSPQTLSRLRDALRQDADRFRELTALETPEWSV